MDQLANRKRTKQLSPPPLFLCFSLCLSPFFYLIILDLKKKGACLSQSQGQVGARLVLGSGRHPLRDPIGPPSRAPGPHWASADPLGVGEHLLSLPSPALASPGLQNKGPVAAAAPRSSYPAGPVQAPGRASIGPELKGAWPHTPPCQRPRPQFPLYSCSRSAAAGRVGRVASVEGEYVPVEGDEVTYKMCSIPPKNEKLQAVEVVITHLAPGTKHETWSGHVISS
nr:calcium-regulated heat stable protein 1 isoform X1 [Rattus norvegicus]